MHKVKIALPFHKNWQTKNAFVDSIGFHHCFTSWNSIEKWTVWNAVEKFGSFKAAHAFHAHQMRNKFGNSMQFSFSRAVFIVISFEFSSQCLYIKRWFKSFGHPAIRRQSQFRRCLRSNQDNQYYLSWKQNNRKRCYRTKANENHQFETLVFSLDRFESNCLDSLSLKQRQKKSTA